MVKTKTAFSILITTKNRKADLAFTLGKIKNLLDRDEANCIICDDGSTDETAIFLQTQYPNIQLIQNPKSQGLIYSRNRLLNLVNTKFAISIDDDLHFLIENPFGVIENYFKNNPKCGLQTFRIFWSIKPPTSLNTKQESALVKSYAGGAHVFRMEAWQDIPNYPDWFVFYGEEDFASFQLFKKGWEVHYVPEILVHHRVDIKARKNEKDYRLRLRRSLRSGWYLYFLFYPWREIPRRFAYTLWMQIKNKVLKGDWKATLAIIQALGDVIINFPKLLKNSNRLSLQEFRNYNKLSDAIIYWSPEEKTN